MSRWEWGSAFINRAFVLAHSLQNPLCSLQGEAPKLVTRDSQTASMHAQGQGGFASSP